MRMACLDRRGGFAKALAGAAAALLVFASSSAAQAQEKPEAPSPEAKPTEAEAKPTEAEAKPTEAEAKPTKTHRLRVLCYNIHFGQGTDGKYDLERLADVIKKEKPDLVALQEVDVGVARSGTVHQLRQLAAKVGMAGRYGPTQHFQGGLYGNAVLSNRPILDVHIQPLPYSPSTKEKTTFPRGAIAVTVEAPDGKPLRFISTHFQHNVEEDRIAQSKAINEYFADDGDAVRTILAGDMNAKPEQEPIRILEKRWQHAIDEAKAPTAPSKEPRSRIDYIFFRPEGSFRVKEARVILEPLASDHCPVFAEFEWESNRED